MYLTNIFSDLAPLIFSFISNDYKSVKAYFYMYPGKNSLLIKDKHFVMTPTGIIFDLSNKRRIDINKNYIIAITQGIDTMRFLGSPRALFTDTKTYRKKQVAQKDYIALIDYDKTIFYSIHYKTSIEFQPMALINFIDTITARVVFASRIEYIYVPSIDHIILYITNLGEYTKSIRINNLSSDHLQRVSRLDKQKIEISQTLIGIGNHSNYL